MDKEIKYNIVMLDDDDFLVDMYATKFSTSGIKISAFKNGQQLLDYLKTVTSLDLILLDISYPRELKYSWNESLEERIYYFNKSKNYIFFSDFLIPSLNSNKLINFTRNIFLKNENVEIKKKTDQKTLGSLLLVRRKKKSRKKFY